MVGFHPSLVAETGCHVSAVALSQIMYWHRGRLQISHPHRPELWLVKSRTEMCAETGITLDQYKRVMPLLARKGLIKLERHLYKNKITPFIRLTGRGETLMAECFATKPSAVRATNPLVSPPTKHKGTETFSETFSDVSASATGQTETSTKIQEKSMKAEDILKQKKEIVIHDGSLGGFWKKRVEMLFGGYQKMLSLKELSQLKKLKEYVGSEELARNVIDYALNNWVKFVSITGAGAPPGPDVGYVLKHHAVVVNILQPVAQTQVEQKPSPPQIVTGPVPEDPYVMTDDEFEEILKGLKE